MSTQPTHLFRLAIIINPVAGLGGPAGLKGSDSPDTPKLARERGVESQVHERVQRVLNQITDWRDQLEILAPAYPMGPEDTVGISCTRFYSPSGETSAVDTQSAVAAAIELKPDLILFAGGDGTARDVCSVLQEQCPVLGVPAGVKMHSGVFAVTPEAAASVLSSLISGRLVALKSAEVRDIDEVAFAQGQVKTRHYGEMLVPDDQMLVQKVKCSGLPDDDILLEDLSAYLVEMIEDDDQDGLWILGSGGTMKAVKEKLGMESPTLLGVDLWYAGETIATDVYENELWDYVQQFASSQMMVSVIGGQGVIFGRGNQQLSARIIEHCGLENLHFVSTTEKLKALEGRALSVDSGAPDLDQRLAGFRKVICGYEETLLYAVK